MAIFEHNSYQPGETARALIGATALKGVKYLEVLAGNFLLSTKMLPAGGVSLAEVKVGRAHRGGFGLRWFGASGFKIYSAMAEADVALKDRELSLNLAYDKVLRPGQRALWALRAKDAAGKPVSGEGTVRIFDRSLEYYQKDAGFWTDPLYPKRRSTADGRASLFTPYAITLPITTGLIKRMLDLFSASAAQERLPAFRINSSRLYPGRGGFFQSKMMMGEMADASLSMSEGVAGAAAGFAVRGEAKMALAKKDKAGPSENEAVPASPAQAPVQVRKDFSETAYFNPQLKVKNGSGKFSFTIPERLTSWKISSYMITRDVKRGKVSGEAVTKKDLMVRLDIPRFFREGDKSMITAVVNNESGADLSGEVVLSVTLDGSPAEEKFALKGLSKPFTVKAAGTTPLYWEIKAPSGTAAYKVRAVARAGALSDAQENDLPVLPSRERLIASVVASLDGAVQAPRSGGVHKSVMAPPRKSRRVTGALITSTPALTRCTLGNPPPPRS